MEALEEWCGERGEEIRNRRGPIRAAMSIHLSGLVGARRGGVSLHALVVDALPDRIRIEIWLDGDGSDWRAYVSRLASTFTLDGHAVWTEIIDHTPGSRQRP